MDKSKIVTALNAVTGTTTSNKIFVGDAKRVAILLRAAAISTGNGAFTVKASMDAGDTVTPVVTAYNVLIDNVTNTNVQGFTRVNGKTLAANGDAFLWLSPEAKVNWLEITVTRTTDGTYSAFVLMEQ